MRSSQRGHAAYDGGAGLGERADSPFPLPAVPRAGGGWAAAAGIALVTMIANVGSFAGPTLIGVLKTKTGTHTAAFAVLGGLAVIAALLALKLDPAQPRSSERPA